MFERKKNKNKKFQDTISVVQHMRIVEQTKKEADMAQRESQRKQEAERLRCNKAHVQAKEAAVLQAKEQHRLRQIELNNQRKVNKLSVKQKADEQNVKDMNFLDELIQDNNQNNIINDHERLCDLCCQCSNKRSGSHNKIVKENEQSMQKVLDWVEKLELKNSDQQQVCDVMIAGKNLSCDAMVVREIVSSVDCRCDEQFFLDAIVVLKKIIKADKILFRQMNSIKKYKYQSAQRVVLNSFQNFASQESICIKINSATWYFIYSSFYDIYEATFDYAIGMYGKKICNQELIQDLEQMEFLLEYLEKKIN